LDSFNLLLLSNPKLRGFVNLGSCTLIMTQQNREKKISYDVSSVTSPSLRH